MSSLTGEVGPFDVALNRIVCDAMRPLSPGHTTVPSASTGAAAVADGPYAIRWVFPEEQGGVSVLSSERLLLGRADDVDIPLPGTETSRHHAEIVRHSPLWLVRDLGSRNGVHINGRPVAEAPLSVGDVVRLGEWVGIVISTHAQHREGEVFASLAPKMYGGPVLRSVLAQAQRAATSTLPLVIEGETGTGKEGVARAIHQWSGRRGPFIAVNCAALPESMAEAELFGYRRGAFTGAERSSPGYVRSAHEGTLLLDEIVDMPLALQAKLLRALEQREVTPLGEVHPISVDVRVIVAAQSPLSQAVQERRFRGDLLARLAGLTLTLSPLRQRKEEIAYVFGRLMRDHSGGHAPAVEAKLIERLCLYDWPFNLRELDLLVRRLLVLHVQESVLKRSHLPAEMMGVSRHSASNSTRASPEVQKENAPVLVDRVEEQRARDARDLAALVAGLRSHAGNVAKAATAAGITRQRAYRLMEANPGVDLEAFRSAQTPQEPTEGDGR